MQNRRVRHLRPASIQGCQLALIGYLMTGFSNTDPVATWADVSGNGRDATQGTSGNRPTYVTNQSGGLPGVSFDGSNDFLTSAFSTVSQPIAVFVVASIGGSFNFGRAFDTNSASAGDRMTFGKQFSDEALIQYAGGSVITWPDFLPTPIACWSLTFNGASSFGCKNGVQVTSGNFGSVGAVDGMTIGAANPPNINENLQGVIQELVMYNFAPAAPLRNRLQQSLGFIYRLPVAA